MTADDKINEAEYNFEKLKIHNFSDNKIRYDIRYEISNFLSSAQSIIYHMLEDYNQKLGFNIKRIDIKFFVNLPKNTDDEKLIDFSKWFSKWYDKIKGNPDCGFLINMRNVNVNKKTVRISSAVTTTSTSYVSAFRKKQVKVSHGTGIWWGFNENPDYDVESICEMYLSLLKKMVNDAKRTF